MAASLSVSRTKAARSIQLNLFKDRRGSVDSKLLTFEVRLALCAMRATCDCCSLRRMATTGSEEPCCRW
jgi:hypothetical protein